MEEFKPNPRLVGKYALWVATTVALYLPFVLMGLIPELGWVYVAFFLGATILWVLPTLVLIGLYCRTIRYALSGAEIVVKKGLLTKTEKIVPYAKVTNVELKRGIWDRLLGLGTLQIHTAGFSQQTNAEAVLSGLDDWEGVRRQVMARVHAHKTEDEARPGALEGAGAIPQDAAPYLRDLLDEVRGVRAALDALRTAR
ncbi:MAG: PH domain-containing protein [Anaerolineae bacterium]